MRLEHYRSRQQMIEQQARTTLDTKLAMSMAPVTQPSQHQTPMTDRLPLVTQAPGPGAESPAPSAQPTAIWPPMAMAVAAPPPTTTLAVADKSEEELKFATALSLSDQTVHLPRIHAFFTSQSQWLEPISSFLRTVCTSKRPGCFAAFHAVIEELLVKHLLDGQPSRHEDHHGRGRRHLLLPVRGERKTTEGSAPRAHGPTYHTARPHAKRRWRVRASRARAELARASAHRARLESPSAGLPTGKGRTRGVRGAEKQ